MHGRIDPIAQFLKEHEEALRHLKRLRKSSEELMRNGYSKKLFDQFQTEVGFIAEEVGEHNRKEEQALFPVIEHYVEGPTQVMREEHKELERLYQKLVKHLNAMLKNKESVAALHGIHETTKLIVQLMVNHIHKENSILFPMVQKFLSKEALREVARRML
ncbi:MAG: hemerythrin domain-containing protein [Bacteroidota bacterium]